LAEAGAADLRAMVAMAVSSLIGEDCRRPSLAIFQSSDFIES
jgi:hypothetical protein